MSYDGLLGAGCERDSLSWTTLPKQLGGGRSGRGTAGKCCTAEGGIARVDDDHLLRPTKRRRHRSRTGELVFESH